MSGKSDVIFASLPSYLEFAARFARSLGHDVYYITLPAASAEEGLRRAASLQGKGINPLPLESASHLTGVRMHFTDPGGKLEAKLDKLLPLPLLESVAPLFTRIDDAPAKLRLSVKTGIASLLNVPAQANLWVTLHAERKHVVIFPELSGLFAVGLEANANAKVIVLPIASVFAAFGGVGRKAASFTRRRANGAEIAAAAPSAPLATEKDEVALVTHKGLAYGDLFQKELYYSPSEASPLHASRLLHFDYSGFPKPSPETRWVQLRGKAASVGGSIGSFLSAIGRGLGKVRSAQQLLGLLLLARLYSRFDAYRRELEAFPNLKLALIDFEILCPKSLLLALEASGVGTVAAQERLLLSFYSVFGTILRDYLCVSGYAAGVMQKSSSYSIGRYHAVGQYRSDNLLAERKSAPPAILTGAASSGRKIVTALGFHTHMEWYGSAADPMLSWTAHLHFLEDMLRLSADLENVFLVLRFKFVDWTKLEVFADVIARIEASENIVIAGEYDVPFYSYLLCAHSDLVIAKHTSLGDECLAVGIPVLFHDYTHNTERLVSDAFDYRPLRVMCYDYSELLARSQAILSGSAEMAPDFEYAKQTVFGGLGDGHARERIHQEVARLMQGSAAS